MVYQGDLYLGGQRQGSITGRGDFDQYAAYRPGDVVLDGGAPYLCTAPVGGPLIARDTFARADASRWGVSSDGQQWNPYVQAGDVWAATVVSGAGRLAGDAENYASAVLLTDASSDSTNREVLVQASIDTEPSPSNCRLQLILGSDTDQQNFTMVQVYRQDGENLGLLFAGYVAASPTSADVTGAVAPALGDAFWVRVRRQGSNVTARAWLPGTAEPSSWDLTHAVISDAWGRLCGVGMATSDPDMQLTVRYFSARALTAADAPGDDADHWVPLSTAFALPLPV